MTKQPPLIAEPHLFECEEPLELESRGRLERYTLIYETYGELNADKSNAILICHALSGDHHAAGSYLYDDQSEVDRSCGWWSSVIGPGKPIDTNRFFVVCSNNLGGCGGSTGPSSINPATNKPFGPDFPIVTVRDWVASQAKLSDALGVQQWAAVVGGSLGGMQVLQWSIDYPKRIRHGLVIASAARLTAQNIGFNDVARQAIRTDPDFHDGDYYQHATHPARGLRIARMLGHITYLSDDAMANKFGRSLRKKAKFDYEFNPEFEVESYLRYQGDQFVNKFDANTYLLMTKALDYFDPAAEHDGDLQTALNAAKASFLVVSFSTDWRFPPERSREIVRALQSNKRDVCYAEITSQHGHDSFLLEIEDYFSVLSAYLNKVARDVNCDVPATTAISTTTNSTTANNPEAEHD